MSRCECHWCLETSFNSNFCFVRKIPYSKMSFLDKFYYDYLVDPLINFSLECNFTPNIVTGISVNVLMIGFYYLFNDQVLGFAICWFLYFVLDCVDGCLSRLTCQETLFGDWFDHTRDVIALIVLNLILFYKKKYGLIIVVALLTLSSINQLSVQEKFLSTCSKNNYKSSDTFAFLSKCMTPVGTLDNTFIKYFTPTINTSLIALIIFYFY